MATVIYRVIGMTCEHCVHAVAEEPTNLGGVTGVTVALVPGGESGVTVTSQVETLAGIPEGRSPAWAAC